MERSARPAEGADPATGTDPPPGLAVVPTFRRRANGSRNGTPGLTRTQELEARVDAATEPAERLSALIDLVGWLADAHPRRALGRADEALAAARQLADPALLTRAHVERGHARLFAVNPRSAYEELRGARQRYGTLHDPVGMAWADQYAAIALEYLGDPGGATVLAEGALATFRAEGVAAGEARALNTLGVGQFVLGRLDDSLALLQRAGELGAYAADPVSAGLARLNAAEVRGRIGARDTDEGRVDEGRESLSAALAELQLVFRHAVSTGFVGLEPAALCYQVAPLIRLGRTDEAVELAERAIARAGALELDDAAAPALHFAGEAYLAHGDLDRAASHLQRALALFEQWDLIHETVAVFRLLVETHERRGDIPTAFAFHKRLLAAELKMRDGIAEREDQVAAARYEAERELKAAERGRRQLQRLARANRRLVDERQAMERLAHTDGLTGLANRRHFDAQLARLLVQAELTGADVSLVMVDVDHFKRVNDQHSHLVGDAVLRSLATEISRHCRVSDLAARIGGEEFAVLLPTTTLLEARAVAERLRASVAALDLSAIAPGLRITVSAGVSSSAAGTSVEALLAAADAALYAAKRGGRNRVRGAVRRRP